MINNLMLAAATSLSTSETRISTSSKVRVRTEEPHPSFKTCRLLTSQAHHPCILQEPNRRILITSRSVSLQATPATLPRQPVPAIEDSRSARRNIVLTLDLAAAVEAWAACLPWVAA